MLRFIQENRKNLPETGQFQYIPCYGLSPKVQQYIDRVESFQYIPCYGLSALGAGLREPPLYFNTSHVTVYPLWAPGYESRRFISIHPMLRFIKQKRQKNSDHPIFQYIPCYGLSLTFLDSTPNMFHFNTSHVTVYLAPKVPHSADNGFQYIPCYGLSKGECCKVVVISPFQYIPCYGLSALGAGLREPPLYFNTSHVTVYQTEASKEFRSSHISIHPMLRFIISATDGTLFFKNFNTSHVTVYHLIPPADQSL